MFTDLNTIRYLWPEVILVLCAAWIYLGGAFRPARGWWTGFASAAYILAAVVILATEAADERGFTAAGVASGPIVVDQLGTVFRALAVFFGFLFTILAFRGTRHELHSEYQGTLMLLTAGVMVVARANDLVLMFVGLELISVPTYVLLFLGRRDRSTAEATLKYFYLSILSSALLLYGFSFLYGLTGTTTLQAVGDEMTEARATLAQLGIGVETLTYLALVLIVAGLGFRLAAVPFHFYAPDVYQGVSNINAGLLAVIPKLAGVLAFVRLLLAGFPEASSLAWELLLVLAVLTMTLGNVCALWQQNIRRLLAYSSIAHAGYLLIGLTVAFANVDQPAGVIGGVASTLVYVFVYSLAALGSFAALAYLGGERQELNSVDELAGLARSQPVAAAALAVCMFSLAGLPPLAGFWGKLILFFGAIQTATASTTLHTSAWFIVLATAGAVNAAIGAAYYLRIVATMFFRPAISPPNAEGGSSAAAVMLTCAGLLLALGLLPGPMLDLARNSELSFRAPITAIAQPAAASNADLADASRPAGAITKQPGAERMRRHAGIRAALGEPAKRKDKR